mgnify:CR=1 FL=1
MIRRPPRSTLDRSSAASDVYKRQTLTLAGGLNCQPGFRFSGSQTLLSGRGSVLTTGVHPVPVSYTHLRAHETVLDIVCRLLLEKKKDRQETDSIAL